jgi:hypothetical protein
VLYEEANGCTGRRRNFVAERMDRARAPGAAAVRSSEMSRCAARNTARNTQRSERCSASGTKHEAAIKRQMCEGELEAGTRKGCLVPGSGIGSGWDAEKRMKLGSFFTFWEMV